MRLLSLFVVAGRATASAGFCRRDFRAIGKVKTRRSSDEVTLPVALRGGAVRPSTTGNTAFVAAGKVSLPLFCAEGYSVLPSNRNPCGSSAGLGRERGSVG